MAPQVTAPANRRLRHGDGGRRLPTGAGGTVSLLRTRRADAGLRRIVGADFARCEDGQRRRRTAPASSSNVTPLATAGTSTSSGRCYCGDGEQRRIATSACAARRPCVMTTPTSVARRSGSGGTRTARAIIKVATPVGQRASSRTWLRQYPPFQDLSVAAQRAAQVANVRHQRDQRGDEDARSTTRRT